MGLELRGQVGWAGDSASVCPPLMGIFTPELKAQLVFSPCAASTTSADFAYSVRAARGTGAVCARAQQLGMARAFPAATRLARLFRWR